MPKEEFKALVLKSNSIQALLVALGYGRNSGSMFYTVKARIEQEEIDTSHMGKNTFTGKYALSEVLVEHSTYTNIQRLKQRILNAGLFEDRCAECGLSTEWNGKEIHMHLDHINGVSDDHRIENIRFLCPNCHSQTETYGGKNNGRYK